MADVTAGGPPEIVRYSLDEALRLLAALEDARDALIDSGHLAVVIAAEAEIRTVTRRLGFGDPSEAFRCLTLRSESPKPHDGSAFRRGIFWCSSASTRSAP